VDGNFRVRVGMMTPNLITPFLANLVASFKSEKVFKFVHLPVQSGDDDVLRRMRRFYTASEFKQTVAAFRKDFPEITLSTDIIIGFPSETEEAFENTLKLIREVEPDIVNVSKFFARPKTAAWDMRTEAVDKLEIKRRSAKATELVKEVSFLRSQRWSGWKGEILVDERGKFPGTWIGRNFAYKPVAVKSDAYLLGKTVSVKATKAFATHLAGTLE
jgi:threonylcarbamoyladenosine tRNA methylthiotransferase CDKAL1